jgi:hypothetical protein
MIGRLMRVLDWLTFPLLLWSAIIIVLIPSYIILTDEDIFETIVGASEGTGFHFTLAAYIFIKIIIYVVQGTWRWFPWSKK